MNKTTCPYCGTLTDREICPRCLAAIPRDAGEKSTKAEKPAKKASKNDKEG